MELPAITTDDYELDVVEQFAINDYELDVVEHHHQQPLPGHWDREEDWKDIHNTCSPHFTSVDQPQTDSEDQEGRVQCLFCQRTDVWQRDMDHICRTGEKTQFLPPE